MTFNTFYKSVLSTAAIAAMTGLMPTGAQASNGQLPHCVGTYKCGMGGAGLTIASDPTAATINPALAARMGNEAILNAGWFNADVDGHLAENGGHGSRVGDTRSDASDFANGSLGVNYKVDDNMGVNISIYPGGGGATDWDNSRTRNFGGGTGDNSDGTDHMIRWRMFNMQAALAWAPNEKSAVGLGVIVSRSDMTTDSLDNSFGRPDPGPFGEVDRVWGYGVQVGGVYDVGDKISVAAKYHSKVKMQRFKKYLNIFNSSVDRPPVWAAGITARPDQNTDVALDVKYIENSEVKTISSAPQNDGGFGWRNQTVLMVGAQHRLSDDFSIRAGWNYGESPIDENHVFANFLFPAIIEHHFTAGLTYDMGSGMELGWSGYITPTAKQADSGNGDAFSRNNPDTVLKHQQMGTQISLKYKF